MDGWGGHCAGLRGYGEIVPPTSNPAVPVVTTRRLKLRGWRDSDVEPFVSLNADPQVMEFFPDALDRVESLSLVERLRSHWEEHGLGMWAVEETESGEFIGMIGLLVVGFDAPFTHDDVPPVEAGWRLRRQSWGHGYASEAAAATLGWGLGKRRLPEIVSFTSVLNTRSIHVMERLGMTHDPTDDFDHPALADGHPLRRHVLYRSTS